MAKETPITESWIREKLRSGWVIAGIFLTVLSSVATTSFNVGRSGQQQQIDELRSAVKTLTESQAALTVKVGELVGEMRGMRKQP